jgi:hypothetical protein
VISGRVLAPTLTTRRCPNASSSCRTTRRCRSSVRACAYASACPQRTRKKSSRACSRARRSSSTRRRVMSGLRCVGFPLCLDARAKRPRRSSLSTRASSASYPICSTRRSRAKVALRPSLSPRTPIRPRIESFIIARLSVRWASFCGSASAALLDRWHQVRGVRVPEVFSSLDVCVVCACIGRTSQTKSAYHTGRQTWKIYACARLLTSLNAYIGRAGIHLSRKFGYVSKSLSKLALVTVLVQRASL